MVDSDVSGRRHLGLVSAPDRRAGIWEAAIRSGALGSDSGRIWRSPDEAYQFVRPGAAGSHHLHARALKPPRLAAQRAGPTETRSTVRARPSSSMHRRLPLTETTDKI